MKKDKSKSGSLKPAKKASTPEEEVMAKYPPAHCLRLSEKLNGEHNFVTNPLPLPRELAPLILRYLSPKGLVAAGGTCRLWYTISSHDQLWQRFFDKSAGRTEHHTFKELFLDLQLEKKRRNVRRQHAMELHKSWKRRAACGKRRQPRALEPRPKVEPEAFVPDSNWPVHPALSNELTVEFGFDIVKSAEEVINFLNTCANDDTFKDPEFLTWALWRYTRFMQLKADHPGRFLVPTTEIEYVWQSHLLRTENYAHDSKQVWHVEGLIDHRILGTDADVLLFEEALRETAELWERTYGEEYCKISAGPVRVKMPAFRDGALSCSIQEEGNKRLWFDVDLSANKRQVPAGWTSPISLKVEDLIKDGEWFGHFGKENSISAYGLYLEEGWHKLAAKAYERFLYFCYIDTSEEMAHPTYAIDLMWHVHMFHPKLYREDMVRLTGSMMDHEPWPDHYEEANFTRVNDVWQREFGIPIEQETRRAPWA